MQKFRATSTTATPDGEVGRPYGTDTTFNVRQPGYAASGEKAPSDVPLFIMVGYDVFTNGTKVFNVGERVELPPVPEHLAAPVAGVPPYFIVNSCIPSYDPPNPVWGPTRTDGPGFSLVIYFLMTPETREALLDLDTAPPAVKLLRNFVLDDSTEMRDRFKIMGDLVNFSELEFGYATNQIVEKYNQKPVLSRPEHFFFTDNNSFFEVDIDVHIFGYVPKSVLAACRGELDKLHVEMGFVIQGNEDDELPETVLGQARMHGYPNEHRPATSLEQHIINDAKAREEERAAHAAVVQRAA